MADTEMKEDQKDKVNLATDELHAIAARLAGIESILNRVSDDGNAALGNTLYLMAHATAEANSQICGVADRLSGLWNKNQV